MCRLGIRVCWSLISTGGGKIHPRFDLDRAPILTPVATLVCVFFGRRNPFNGGLQNAPVSRDSHLSPPYLPPSMFEQHISSDILLNHTHDDKLISRNLYLCQPHTVIQLIEVASPPPRRISSVIYSSSAASSSYTSSSSSSFEEDQGEEELEEEEKEESVHSSYCSSDDDMDVRLSPRAASHPDTLSGSMKRILLWREQSPQLLSGWCTRSS